MGRRAMLQLQTGRFLVAGGVTSALNWLVRFPLSRALPLEAAVAVAYGIGMLAGFLVYRAWVFPGSLLSLRRQILRFVLINMFGLCAVLIASRTILTVMEQHGVIGPFSVGIAHGCAIVIGAALNFVGHKIFTFAAAG